MARKLSNSRINPKKFDEGEAAQRAKERAHANAIATQSNPGTAGLELGNDAKRVVEDGPAE